MRIRLSLFAVVISLLVSPFNPVSANAASGYDDVITLGEAKVNCSIGGDEFDVSTSYMQIIQSAPSSYAKTAFIDALNDAYDEGSGWFLSQNLNSSGQFFSLTMGVNVGSDGTAYFIDISSVEYLMSPSATFTALIYCNQEIGGEPYYEAAFNAGWVSREIAYDAGIDNERRPVFVNMPIDYPFGYDGVYTPTEMPLPPTTSYTGTVDCGGEDPAYVLISQVGNNGPATLTPLTLGRVEWSYELTNDPYAVTVGCGDKLATSFAAVSPLPPTSHDWVCDVYGTEPYYCVLS